MEVPAGLEQSELQQCSTLETCFVDIPNFLDTNSDQCTERIGGDTDCSEGPAGYSQSCEATNTFDVSNFLELDFAFEKPIGSALERRSSGQSKTGKEDRSMVNLLGVSSSQECRACVPNRLSEESTQSVGGMQTPFKLGYYKSEADLFPDFAKKKEAMLFVPLTGSSADRSGKRKHIAVDREMPTITELGQEQDFNALAPAAIKKLRVDMGVDTSEDKHGSTTDSPRAARSKRRKKSTESIDHSADVKSELRKREADSVINLGTPDSVVSDLPIIGIKRKAQAREEDGGGREEAQTDGIVLMPSSPNLPRRKASRVLKLTASAKKTANKLSLEKEPEAEIYSRKRASARLVSEGLETAEAVTQDRRVGKAAKRPILTDWTQSENVVPYPDKNTRHQLAVAAGLSFQQVRFKAGLFITNQRD
ncbi:hypothetical protein KFL_001730270 [Klebsormidium nitens]|uniref:Homeobox domain-containing protein n=1 Tax=Klebsormidium nitens TaxID=105231 RepID=A0A1Y1HZE6_KLENI|nr:hypothetical protein KFL_001730270 [Klebsormidium nitens]|eukprot:GAQ84034.1 hypothetical protein KFL_001730270 [Klebsormidium nitens]